MNASQELKETYSLEDFKEIANHGCQSGVCHEHIYYADTIKFFDKYDEEITEYFVDNYGDTEFLIRLFDDAMCNLDSYKNDVTWAFIESVALDVTDCEDEAA